MYNKAACNQLIQHKYSIVSFKLLTNIQPSDSTDKLFYLHLKNVHDNYYLLIIDNYKYSGATRANNCI